MGKEMFIEAHKKPVIPEDIDLMPRTAFFSIQNSMIP